MYYETISWFSFWPYNKSFFDQACSVMMAGYWPRSCLRFYRPRRTWTISLHGKWRIYLMNAICYIVARLTLLLMVLLFSQSCHEDDGRKDSSSDSEQKITQQLLDQELLVHQERLIQLLDQGDNEIFMDHEAPILTADLSGTEMLCT